MPLVGEDILVQEVDTEQLAAVVDTIPLVVGTDKVEHIHADTKQEDTSIEVQQGAWFHQESF